MLFIFGMLTALILTGIFHFGVFIPQSKKDNNQAIHNYVQFMYDNKMLNRKAINAMKIDIKTGQYDWKL